MNYLFTICLIIGWIASVIASIQLGAPIEMIIIWIITIGTCVGLTLNFIIVGIIDYVRKNISKENITKDICMSIFNIIAVFISVVAFIAMIYLEFSLLLLIIFLIPRAAKVLLKSLMK